MTLKATIASDATTVFCNTDEFAETVTYYPHRFYNDTARANREISAVVIRQHATVFAEDAGETVLPVFEVHIANDSTAGISSQELDLGGDQIGMPPRDGKAAETKTIVQIVSQDNGMLVLECR